MRAFWFTCICALFVVPANAELLMYENFSYPYDLGADPQSNLLNGKVNANGKTWIKPTAGQPTAANDAHRLVPNDYTVVGGSGTPGAHLQVPNSPQLNISKTALPLLPGMGGNAYTSAEPSLFSSFYLRLNNYTTIASPSYESFFAGFHTNGEGAQNGGMTLNATTSVGYAGTVRIRSSASMPGKYELGLSKTAHYVSNGTSPFIKWSSPIDPLTTLQVVVEYDLVGTNTSSTTDDVARLWINPPPGVLTTAPTLEIAAADAFPDTSSSGGTIRSFYFRSDTRNPGMLHFDDLRIGTAFRNVLPEPGSLALASFAVALLGLGRRRTR